MTLGGDVKGDVSGDVNTAREGNDTCGHGDCVILTTRTVNNNNNTGRDDKPRGQCIVVFLRICFIDGPFRLNETVEKI